MRSQQLSRSVGRFVSMVVKVWYPGPLPLSKNACSGCLDPVYFYRSVVIPLLVKLQTDPKLSGEAINASDSP